MSLLSKHRLRVSGGELAYLDVGEGPAVVLLHGFPLSSFQWREFLPLLAGRFRVIAPDLLGAGDSEKPDDAPVHLRAEVGYVRELLDGLGIERCAVVGHGIGGGIAQLLALDGGRVDALVLLDAVVFDDWPAESMREAQARIAQIEPSASLARAELASAFDVGMRHRSRLSDEALQEYARPWVEGAGPAAFARMLASLDGEGLTEREHELGKIDAPVLILWGEDDPFYPPAVAERLNEAIPSSTLGLLPGCGHFLPEEAPETIGPMIAEYLRARYLNEPHGHDDKAGVVMLQLERRPPWVDLEEYERDDWFDTEEGE